MYPFKRYIFLFQPCFKRTLTFMNNGRTCNQLRVLPNLLNLVFDKKSYSSKYAKPDIYIKPSKIRQSKSRKERANSDDNNFEVTPPEFFRKRNELYENDERSILSAYEGRLNSDEYTKSQSLKEIERDIINRARSIRYKTIEKKYFKKEKNLNLLTWKAKEQMRHLHYNKGRQWPVTELCDHFPVCEDSVYKILKSRLRLYTAEQIESHDETVRKNWVGLLQKIQERQELPVSVIKGFFDSNEQCVISNALGLSDQPFDLNPLPDLSKKSGVFSDIVSDCSSPKILPEIVVDEKDSIENILRNIVSEIKELGVGPQTEESIVANERKKDRKKIRSANSQSNDSYHSSKLGPNSNSNTVYRKGNSVYDQNGHFLYSLP